jgi:V/A-type H+-transporting ATPase subunit D
MNGETVTRHNFLALREEHGFIREGFAFLDEKRMLLAQQILAEHADYRRRRTALATAWEAAIAALAEALGESGLLPLAVAEIPRRPPPLPELARHAHFGVPLLRLTTADDPAAARPAGWQTPQQLCAEAFARVTTAAAAVAASAGNLQRLVAEYRRTDRRARALENVILPELAGRLHVVEAALEDSELEESLRTRLAIAHASGLV